MPSDRYTRKADESVRAAKEIAERHRHHAIDDVHLLAALVTQTDGLVPNVLERIGVEKEFAITGGIAKNVGVVRRLEKELGLKALSTTYDAQIAGGVGAALFGKALVEKGGK